MDAAKQPGAGGGPRLWFSHEDIETIRRRAQSDDPGTLGVSGRQLWANVRARAIAFAGRRFTATYGDLYGIPLPEAPQPPPHPEHPQWPYWTGIASELASHLELTAAMCVVEPSDAWWERLDRLVAGVCSWERWTDPDFAEGRYVTCLDTAFLTTAAAMVYDWAGAGLAPERRAQLRRALVEKGLEPLARQAATPGNFISDLSWVNGSGQAIAALGIGALALLGEEARAADWARLAEEKARAWIERHVHPGGALAEQMGYGGWMADVFALHAAAAERLTGADLAGTGSFREILEYGIALLTPDGAQTVNFGDDGDVDGTPPSLQLYARYWAAVRSDPRAQWYLAVSGAGRVERTVNPRVRADISISGLMRLVWHRVEVPAEAPDPRRTTFSFPAVGIVSMRTGWGRGDSLVAVRGGPRLPHGHLDCGSFMIYSGGRWLVWDPGYAVFNMRFPPGIVAGDVAALSRYTATNLGHSTVVVDGEPCPGASDVPPPAWEPGTGALREVIANAFRGSLDWGDLLGGPGDGLRGDFRGGLPRGVRGEAQGDPQSERVGERQGERRERQPEETPVVRVDAGAAYRGQLERFVRRFCFLPPARLVIVDDVVPVPHAASVEWRVRTSGLGTWRPAQPAPGAASCARWMWESGPASLRLSFWVSGPAGACRVDAHAGPMQGAEGFGEHLGLRVSLGREATQARAGKGAPLRLVAATVLDWS